MRIQYKGGVWKNSEDEILKAAVMKYGQNQWARIASLLVRKSAKQCKARWFEWLDPAIKKTQWTREEEEKLLHLVKIMPTQWRTIAPMIGRTAAQCIEHYEKLIDQAQQQQAAADASRPTDADPKAAMVAASRQRPGDLDAAPESKPARPDPVDMDEDELEMLSEARARLANTKGKKAKRKTREQQLEAAKRVAQLQKRRELKAAGVPIKPPRKSRKFTDYATEIPFERAPAPGFYDTREEDEHAANIMSNKKQIGKLLQKYKGPTEAEKEEEARKKDTEKRKHLEETNLPAALGLEGILQSTATPRSPPLKRKRFSLPTPQLSDLELEAIGKSGKTPNATRGRSSQKRTSDEAFRSGQPTSARTPLVNSVASTPFSATAEPWAATRQRHLETIMALKSSETPLRGGENTPLPSLGLSSGVTPSRADSRTPNPLATPSNATVTSQEASNRKSASKERKAKQRQLQDIVRRGLAALPDPENEYELDIGDQQLMSNGDDETDVQGELIEDAEEEVQRKRQEADKEILSAKSRLLSSAASKELPVPLDIVDREKLQGNLGYLVDQDRRVLDILGEKTDSVTSVTESAKVLKSLLSDDVPNGDALKRGYSLVDDFISTDTASENLAADILKVLEAEDQKLSEKALKLSERDAVAIDAVDISQRNEEQFRKERESRLKELKDVYAKHGSQRQDDANTSVLWKRLGLEIIDDVRNLDDDEGLAKFVENLRTRVSDALLPSSLSNRLISESKGSAI